MVEHFDPNTHQVKDVDKNVVMTFDSVFFNNLFKGLKGVEVANITMDSAQAYYENHIDKCKKTINIVFLSTSCDTTVTMWPMYFHRSDFHEYNDMITILARVKGLRDSHHFQEWMCDYMKIIRKGTTKIDWGEKIDDALCIRLKEVKTSLKLYMTSYLVYVATSMR